MDLSTLHRLLDKCRFWRCSMILYCISPFLELLRHPFDLLPPPHPKSFPLRSSREAKHIIKDWLDWMTDVHTLYFLFWHTSSTGCEARHEADAFVDDRREELLRWRTPTRYRTRVRRLDSLLSLLLLNSFSNCFINRKEGTVYHRMWRDPILRTAVVVVTTRNNLCFIFL